MQDDKSIVGIIIGLIVVGFIIIGGVYYLAHRSQQPVTTTAPQTTNNTYAPATIDAKHQYSNGTHVVAGTIDLPTPCNTLDASARADSTTTETLVFSSVQQGDICAQTITSKPFKLQFQGPKTMTIQAEFNGKMVNLNLFEVPAGENIDTYKLDIKG